MKNIPVVAPLLSLLLCIALTGGGCHKNNEPDPDSFYIRCKIDGEDYRPNGCANCAVIRLLGDTAFILGANRGFESVLIGVIKLDKIPIMPTKYRLGYSPHQSGSYKNSTTVDDDFTADSLRTGVLNISTIDKTNKVIAGTFSFNAYNPVRNKTVSVTEGKFRWRYTTN